MKENIQAFFKGKSFYLSLLVAICAIFAVAVVFIGIRSNETGNNLVDLNEPIDIASEQSENQLTEGNGISNGNTQSLDMANNLQQNMNQSANNGLLNEGIATEEVDETAEAMLNSADKLGDEGLEEAKEDSTAVINNNPVSSLKFDEEVGLLWPMNGNVIKNYSMDKVIYFETLNQYKCNPAILIEGEVDQEVVCAATGIVKEVINNEETGNTLVMEIGDGYTLEYGQLKNIKAKAGDKIEEGAMIGSIAMPTNYYVVEGSNLYFKVSQNGETINPMLLLR